MTRTLVLAGMLLTVTGCQAIPTNQHPQGMDQAAFAKMWDQYEQCRSGHNAEVLQRHAGQLLRTTPPGEEWYTRLPVPLDRVAHKQPLRIAADPNAMAADCTLRAARAALDANALSVAESLYRSVLSRYPQGDYAYYTDQARLGLFSMTPQTPLVPVARPVSTR